MVRTNAGIRSKSWACVALAMLAWAGCSDVTRIDHVPSGTTLPSTTLPWLEAAVVSDPIAPANADGAGSTDSVVYVSLPPGLLPNVEAAFIRSQRTGVRHYVPMSNAGFDPTMIAARSGDTLAVEIALPGANSIDSYILEVPAIRRPVVVRTDPPRRRRDVPLNASIVVVFSEPMADSTITTKTVRLLQGAVPVAGRVVLSVDRLRAEFIPDDPLAPQTTYELLIATDARDASGGNLLEPFTSDFTTQGDPLTPVNRAGILIDASRDGGAWWFPQWEESPFDPNLWHQGTRLADHLRDLGYAVTELPRPYLITTAVLDSYAIVIRAGVFGSYQPDEIDAYQRYVQSGGSLLLLADHMKFFSGPADGLANAFGLSFAGITRGENTMIPVGDHPVVTGVGPLSYFVGSALLAYPDSALILGRLSPGTYLDRNNNEVQDAGEPTAPPVFGLMRFGAGRIVFAGDVNFWEVVPQPLVGNVLAWLSER